MNEDSRYQRAVRAVWERSYTEYQQWSSVKRESVQPALDALLAWLTGSESEADLIARYWAVGDAPGNVLRPHLPAGFDEDDLLVVEEAAFRLQLLAMRGEG